MNIIKIADPGDFLDSIKAHLHSYPNILHANVSDIVHERIEGPITDPLYEHLFEPDIDTIMEYIFTRSVIPGDWNDHEL